MKIDPERKLFVGFKLDSEMRRQHSDGRVAQRPAFKPGDPAHLDLLDVRGDLYMGRILDGGLALDELADLERNIKSIIATTFSLPKASGQLRIFAIDRDEIASGFAAAS
jgi:hypothetical protein